MSEFNDPELEQLLGRAAGKYPDVNIAYERLQGRVRHARRRRAVVISGVASTLLFTTALVAANRSSESSPSQIGNRESFEATFPDDTTNESSVDDTIDDNSVPVATDAHGTPDITSAGTPDGDGNGNGNGSGDGGNGNGNDGDPSSSSPTTTVAAPTTSEFSGDGGSITVRLADGTLTLISYTSTVGFSVEVQQAGGDRVEVRFQSANHRTRIRIDLQGNSMVPRIEES